MSMTVRPIGYRVLAELTGKRKVGNLEMPDGSNESCIYKVVAVGEPMPLLDNTQVAISVKVGDEIYFNTARAVSCGPPEWFGGRKLCLVEMESILGVFEGEPDPPSDLPKLIVPRGVTRLVH